ncbi:MAG: amidohydrolase family protein [Deltaproteobacteria bacterium]|nr:amidohydrolase family protein [Deltaproteobacteria bacterium]
MSFKVLFSNHVVLPCSEKGLKVVAAAVAIEGADIVAVEEISYDDFVNQAFQDECIRGAARNHKATGGVELVDYADYILCPAFVNAHTHLSMCAFRGIGGMAAAKDNLVEDLFYKLETSITRDDVYAFTKVGAFESLLCGAGTVWDHYYFGQTCADAVADVGLTAVIAPTLQDEGGPGAVWLEQQLQDTEALTDEKYAKKGIVAAVGAHATDTVSASLWRQASQLASQKNIPLHAHVAQSLEEFERSQDRYGKTPVEFLDDTGALEGGSGFLLVHGLFLTDADLARLNPARHTLGYCPFSQIQFGFPTGNMAFAAHGLNAVLGTDAAACNDTMNVQQELRLVAGGPSFSSSTSLAMERFRASGDAADAKQVWTERVQAFEKRHPLSGPAALLSSVWKTPGTLHPGLHVGEIAVGAKANLLVVDLEHPALWPATDVLHALAMSDVATALHAVILQGDYMGHPGDFHGSIVRSELYMAACAEANIRLKALLQRLGL